MLKPAIFAACGIAAIVLAGYTATAWLLHDALGELR